MSLVRRLIGAALLCGAGTLSVSVRATTYYVRTDGGTTAQCTGTRDAAYPGRGARQSCAFNHPFWALQPGQRASNFAPTTVVKPGDTLVIGNGSYMMGYGGPNAENAMCYQPATWGCAIASIPSGIDAAHPTTIMGDCARPPELWGTQRVSSIFDLEHVHDVVIKCLDLTDHSACIEFYRPTENTGGVMACNRDHFPYGLWAANGIYAADVTNLTLAHLDVHGFADYGIQAGRLAGTTTVTDVTLRANGWGGWSGDLGGNDHRSSNTGKLAFSGIKVLWNGCGEAYPSKAIVGCWGQNEGGYGDGFSSAWTGGDWVFEHSKFKHNTQDGLDMLYANGTGSVTIDHVVAWENAGNGIKTSGSATLRNSIINGYCNNWKGFPVAGDGKSGVSGTMCRADGTAAVMEFNGPNQIIALSHNTITGNGDTLFIGGGGDAHYSPNATNLAVFENNILLGQASAIPRNDGGLTALAWYGDAAYGGVVRYRNNLIWNVKHGFCPSGNICKDPLLKNETLAAFDPTLSPVSPARDKATDKGNIGAVQ
ncbi:MAG: hypothetical protein OJF61_002768 [Rhodanobacteraceae bacterium]|nr:MAG: hypothetical protein OJF61_002768 [Rhodanobacteraceae bacterium]